MHKEKHRRARWLAASLGLGLMVAAGPADARELPGPEDSRLSDADYYTHYRGGFDDVNEFDDWFYDYYDWDTTTDRDLTATDRDLTAEVASEGGYFGDPYSDDAALTFDDAARGFDDAARGFDDAELAFDDAEPVFAGTSDLDHDPYKPVAGGRLE